MTPLNRDIINRLTYIRVCERTGTDRFSSYAQAIFGIVTADYNDTDTPDISITHAIHQIVTDRQHTLRDWIKGYYSETLMSLNFSKDSRIIIAGLSQEDQQILMNYRHAMYVAERHALSVLTNSIFEQLIQYPEFIRDGRESGTQFPSEILSHMVINLEGPPIHNTADTQPVPVSMLDNLIEQYNNQHPDTLPTDNGL